MDKDEAYKRGQDYAKNGANKHNCNFAVFATPELKNAWEKGTKDEPYKEGQHDCSDRAYSCGE